MLHIVNLVYNPTHVLANPFHKHNLLPSYRLIERYTQLRQILINKGLIEQNDYPCFLKYQTSFALFFFHIWLLWTFATYKVLIHGVLLPPIDTHVSYTATLCFVLILFITWGAFHPDISPSTTLAKVIRIVSNNFCFLIGFLRAKWNDMFTVLGFWLSQVFKFFIYSILINVTVMAVNPRFDFCNSEISHFSFLGEKSDLFVT